MTGRCRILYVMTTLAVGGAERSLAELIERLDRESFEPHVCALMSGGGGVRDRLLATGVPVYELGVAAGIAELNGVKLGPLLTRLRPHVVHSRLILSNLWARLGRLVGSRVISEERGLAHDRPRWMTAANRWTQRLASIHVANSAAVAEQMRERDRIPGERVRLIYGGVDVTRFSPAIDDGRDLDVVSVTRLETYKGIFDLVDALAVLAADRPRLRCAIVGGGSQHASMKARLDALGLTDKVTLTGEQIDVRALLRRARLFALTSHEEGLPNAVMEAMATGLPVVATAVGGNRELVVDGMTGRLVSARDVSALARALSSYLADEHMARVHGEAGRARAVERFSIDRTVADYVALYDELCRGRRV